MNWWVSWWWTNDMGEFELHSPWWISGERGDGAQSVCAALVAPAELGATEKVRASYDNPPSHIEFRFVEERPADWSPFCDRFDKADWMQWSPPTTPVRPDAEK